MGKKIINGKIVVLSALSLKEITSLYNELKKEEREIFRTIEYALENNDAKTLLTLIGKYMDNIKILMEVEESMFAKEGEDKIKERIQSTQKAIYDRCIKDRLDYEKVSKQYSFDEHNKGNLIGDYKVALDEIDGVYKKYFNIISSKKAQMYQKLMNVIADIKLMKIEKVKFIEASNNGMKFDEDLQTLIEKAKQAIENGEQETALKLSNQIEAEKENDPLKICDVIIAFGYRKKKIYGQIILDCEKQLRKYSEDRDRNIEEAIIIEESADWELAAVNQKSSWESSSKK